MPIDHETRDEIAANLAAEVAKRKPATEQKIPPETAIARLKDYDASIAPFHSKESRRVIDDALLAIESQSAELTRLREQLQVMREALKPFAKAGTLMDLVRRSDADVVYTPVIDANYCITAGDLRRAATALTPPPGGES